MCLRECACETDSGFDKSSRLPWLKANREILGFGELTARRLIGFSNRSLATDLSFEEAQAINRELWGHTSQFEQVVESQTPTGQRERSDKEDETWPDTDALHISRATPKAAWAVGQFEFDSVDHGRNP